MIWNGQDYDPNWAMRDALSKEESVECDCPACKAKRLGGSAIEETENLKLIDAEAVGESRSKVHQSMYDLVTNMTKPLWRESIRDVKSTEMMKNIYATLNHFCMTGRVARRTCAEEFDKCEAGMVLERGHEFLEITKEVCDERGIDVSDITDSLESIEALLKNVKEEGGQDG